MPNQRRVHKAFAYIVHRRQLLVFRHVGMPEAGIQVPAGTIEHGETPAAAALREAREETGLTGLRIARFLGKTDYDMQAFGRDEIHHRYFYLLACTQEPPTTWQHAEEHPADGTAGSIPFQFFWAPLPDGVPALIAGHDALLRQAAIPYRAIAPVSTFAIEGYCCALSPDESAVAVGKNDGSVLLWDIAQEHHRWHTPYPTTKWVDACAFSHDGSLLFSGGYDGLMQCWDAHTGHLRMSLAGHARMIEGCAVSPADTQVATASADGSVKLWRIADGQNLLTLGTVHNDPDWDDDYLIDGSAVDELLQDDPQSAISSCAFNPAGTRIVAGSYDCVLRIWDTQTGRKTQALGKHQGQIKACAWSPDGSLIVSGSRDETLKLWDVPSGREMQTLIGHYGVVAACLFTPDNRHVISAGWDGAIKKWDVATGEIRAELVGHTHRVVDLALSRDGRTLFSLGWDNTLRRWQID